MLDHWPLPRPAQPSQEVTGSTLEHKQLLCTPLVRERVLEDTPYPTQISRGREDAEAGTSKSPELLTLSYSLASWGISLCSGFASPESLSLEHFKEHKLLFCFNYPFLIYFLFCESFISVYMSCLDICTVSLILTPSAETPFLLTSPLLLSRVCLCVNVCNVFLCVCWMSHFVLSTPQLLVLCSLASGEALY